MADIQNYLNEWQKGKEYVDNYIKDFKRLDTIANAQYDGANRKNPNIGDTTIAGITRQIMRTAVKQLPVVSVGINGSKSTVEAITCRYLVNDRILDPATFGKGFVNIIQLAGRGALSRGFNVFQATGTKMYGEFGVVLHFRTKETFEDLKEYVDMVFNDITEQYFLVEVSGDVDIKMPRKLKKDFLNIDGDIKKEEPKTGGIKIDEVRNNRNRDIKNMSFDIFLPMFDPTSPFNKVQEEVLPTVDEILEKITETGIESLTEKEREILDN